MEQNLKTTKKYAAAGNFYPKGSYIYDDHKKTINFVTPHPLHSQKWITVHKNE